MDKERVQEITSEYRTHPTDTGSTQVQIALLTYHIRELTEHLQVHRHDQHSRHGLLTQVGHRRRLLAYLANENPASYRDLLNRLGLRR